MKAMENDMISVFIKRLQKVGIEIELVCNFPWIYLYKVNGKLVTDKFMAEHGFTAFFLSVRTDDPVKYKISDSKKVFKQIREML